MSRSARLSLSYVMPAQAQKHVTVNESLRRLDILVQTAVASAAVAVEPAAPREGEAFILPEGASGPAWSGMAAGSIAAFQDGAFEEIAPVLGHLAFVVDEGRLRAFADAGGWVPVGVPTRPERLGINADADATNRLSVKSDAVLLSHDDVTPGTGDLRQVLNKKASARTAALLFQTGHSARAEIGLLGDDSLSVKVSADGTSFVEALRIDRASARVGVGRAAPACALDVAGPVRVGTFTVAGLPAASAGAGQLVYVSNASGGATLAFSDGAQWRRLRDNAVVAAA